MSRGESRLDELIAAARDDAPAPHARDALRARVWSRVAAPGGAAITPPRAIPPWVAPAAIAAITAGAIGIGWLAHRMTTSEPAPVNTPAPRTDERSPVETPDAPIETRAIETQAIETQAIETRTPAPIETEGARSIPRATRAARADTPAAGDEATLLLAARRARLDDPEGALRMLDEHRARFPGGRLAEEREMLAIDLLVRTGHPELARARAVELVERWPESVYRDRAERVIEEGRVHP
jgi:hypothetical protein